MKPKILKLSTIILLFGFITAGCQDEDEFSEFVEGYIVGSFICNETDSETGIATGNQTPRGFCILIEGSENVNSHYPMDFYTFDIPSELYDFPEKSTSSPLLYSYDCGPKFFPDSIKFNFKVKFQFEEVEKIEFACGPCLAMYVNFPWKDFSEITLKNVLKID